LLPVVLDAALKLSRTLGATGNEAVARIADPARKSSASTSASASSHDRGSAAPALAAPGPHSIFR